MFRIFFAVSLSLLLSGQLRAQSPISLPFIISQIESQTRILLSHMTFLAASSPHDPTIPILFSPRTVEQGRIKFVSSRDWTSGFFPGELWMLYGYTGKEEWKRLAFELTSQIKVEKSNSSTHDMGFKINCSFGNGYRLTKDEHYRQVILESARTLSTRFNPVVGCIRSWDHHREKWAFPVIIDNMMNLELLFLATQLSGDSLFYRIAVLHANTTMKNHFRSDYSSFHVVDYDSATGRVIKRTTWQGFSDSSAWARGQAWGLYAYTMCYRFTKNAIYLRQAEHIADFILHHPRLPSDKIPYWDFDATGIPSSEPRDASAGAIIASGLYELSQYSQQGIYYRSIADTIVQNLTDHYRGQNNEGFILGHSTGSKPFASEVDAPINYADYYYLEALLRSNSYFANKRAVISFPFSPVTAAASR